MDHSRSAKARTINNLRYAVRSGACEAAKFHLKALGHMNVGDKTWGRLIKAVGHCKVARAFQPKRRGRR